MTCVAGVRSTDGSIIMMGDSCGANDYQKQVRTDRKVFRNGEFLIGFSGNFRAGQVVQYNFIPPFHLPDVSTHEYMVRDFIEEMRRTFLECGIMYQAQGDANSANFLIGYRGELFFIDYDYTVGTVEENFMAIGSGCYSAIASLYSTQDIADPIHRLEIALETANRYAIGVSPPFYYLTLEAREEYDKEDG